MGIFIVLTRNTDVFLLFEEGHVLLGSTHPVSHTYNGSGTLAYLSYWFDTKSHNHKIKQVSQKQVLLHQNINIFTNVLINYEIINSIKIMKYDVDIYIFPLDFKIQNFIYSAW